MEKIALIASAPSIFLWSQVLPPLRKFLKETLTAMISGRELRRAGRLVSLYFWKLGTALLSYFKCWSFLVNQIYKKNTLVVTTLTYCNCMCIGLRPKTWLITGLVAGLKCENEVNVSLLSWENWHERLKKLNFLPKNWRYWQRTHPQNCKS